MCIIASICAELIHCDIQAPASISSRASVDPLDIILSVCFRPDHKLYVAQVSEYACIAHRYPVCLLLSGRIFRFDLRMHGFHRSSRSLFEGSYSVSCRQIRMDLVFSRMIFMVGDAYRHLIASVTLSCRFIPHDIALVRSTPYRYLHLAHTGLRFDVLHDHIERSCFIILVRNLNLPCRCRNLKCITSKHYHKTIIHACISMYIILPYIFHIRDINRP